MIQMIRDLFRPICPACNGGGGEMSGYYEPEFVECECCNSDGDNEDEVTRVWRWRWWLQRYRRWQVDRYYDRLGREMDREENWR